MTHGIWESEDFGKLSTLAKLVFIGLFSLADDEGKGKANPTLLKSKLFPYNDNVRSADIEKTLSEISSNMSTIFYTCNETEYYSLLSWNTFQKIDKPSESRIPDFNEDNKEIRRIFDEGSAKARRVFAPNIIEKNINKKENIKRKFGENQNVFFTDEQYEKLKADFPNDYSIRIQKLDDYIASTGKKYKDCLATLRNWARREGYKFPSEEAKQDSKEIDTSNLSKEEYMRIVRGEANV